MEEIEYTFLFYTDTSALSALCFSHPAWGLHPINSQSPSCLLPCYTEPPDVVPHPRDGHLGAPCSFTPAGDAAVHPLVQTTPGSNAGGRAAGAEGTPSFYSGPCAKSSPRDCTGLPATSLTRPGAGQGNTACCIHTCLGGAEAGCFLRRFAEAGRICRPSPREPESSPAGPVPPPRV